MSTASRYFRYAVPLTAIALLCACGALRPGFETPSVSVSSFRTLPSDGMLPNFEIGLRIVNPNRDPLRLVGVAYTVSLNGYEVIEGVGNALPEIAGYSQGDITLVATPNLLAGARLVAEMMRGSTNSVRYELEARLDTGMLFLPIRVTDAGEISLGPAGGR